ncbi:hypothetical protein [Spiroplasma sp. SV19]|uniref:hypothetical protein n=1 Tax=Spiroplasma sp. SV19 TaxID=2570468 RepID=UPI0024B6E985|nr:hypothetical protein [Spiroplasma sp. SV19]WHQ36573.1 hypothetical protein E7Y35_01335 [Spiroplasma sp. SV19]
MKKVLALLGTCSLITTGVTTVISCSTKPDVNPAEDDNDIRKDLDVLLSIMNEAHTAFLNYANEKAVLNIDDYKIPELNQLFGLVNSSKKEDDLDLKTVFGEQINNFFENNFKSVFDNINRQIANEYSNYYVDSMPFTFKTSPSTLKVNYVDLTQLEKLTTEPIKDLKAVVVNYSFGYTGSFKTLTNPTRFNIKYVITNNPNLIKTLMLDLTNKIGKVLIDFINKNPEIIIDQNVAFKETYEKFSVYYKHDTTLINKNMLTFLDAMFKDNAVTKEIMESVNYDSTQDILDLQTATINNENSINVNLPDWRMKYQTPAAWAGSGKQPAGLTPENFVKFYRSNMKIFEDTSKDLTLATFSINFNKIIVAGLPLLASGFNDNKPLMVQINISQNGLTTKLTNFGNIIVALLKYYNVDLKVLGWTSFYISKSLFDEVETRWKGKNLVNLADVYNRLLQDFKQSDIAKTLLDLELFSIQNFRSYWIKLDFNYASTGARSFSIQNAAMWWSLGFGFGHSKNSAIVYTAWTFWQQKLGFVS